MSNPEVILNLPPILNAANTYETEPVEYNAEILSQCSIEDKDVCSISVSDLPMISIVNSSDVIIGSVTQFHGPVTIVQQQAPSKQGIEDKKNEADMVATDYKTKAAPKKPTTPQHCLPKRLLICFAILTLLVSLIVLSIILMLEKRYEEEEDPTSTMDVDPDMDLDITAKYNFTNRKYYTIKQWGGRQPLSREPVTQPIQYVIIAHTAGAFCDSFLTCSQQARNIQNYNVNNGEPNLFYNFLIGGDANIYEGRGWMTKNVIRDHTISVAFMGNFVYDELTTNMIDALLELIKCGLFLETLPDYYRIVAHNQTIITISPGKNVYKVIKELPTFYPGLTPVARG